MVATCPEDNATILDQSSFWDSRGIHWDQHRIGWAIAGGCSVLTLFITIYSVLTHARHYHNRNEQRQIIRILYMPTVYAIISFLSFRFFRNYTYYSLIEVVYEAVTLSAFMLLLVEYVASTASGDKAENALLRKDKKPLPFPFCFWRFRPTKAYFMYTIKWSVMQYVIVRPAISIAGIITQAFGVLCTQSYSPQFAQVYLTAIDFISISVALYGLILFYSLTSQELEGRRPFAKFLCIKGIVMLTFYQDFMFSTLQSYHVIKGTEFWTATNIADGLNALATCIEMVFFAGFMLWAYPAKEYSDPALDTTSIFRPLLDSIKYSDFASEIWSSLRFFFDYASGKPNTHTSRSAGAAVSDPSASTSARTRRPTFDDAFGLHYSGGATLRRIMTSESHLPVIQDVEEGAGVYGEVYGGEATSPVESESIAAYHHDGYDSALGEAIPMRVVVDSPLNAGDVAFAHSASAPPRQSNQVQQYDLDR